MTDTTKAERELATTKRRLDIIRKVSNELNKFIPLKEKLNNFLAMLDEQFGIGHSMILLPDENSRTLSVFASRGYPATHAIVPFGRGIAGMVAERRMPINITNLTQRLNYLSMVSEQEGDSKQADATELPGLKGAESQIAIPMLSGSELIAVFMVVLKIKQEEALKGRYSISTNYSALSGLFQCFV